MSVFDGNQPGKEGAETDDGNQSYVEALVKERGEQWKDPEVIAKGKREADKHIAELNKQLEELKTQSESGKKIEDLLAKMEEATKSKTTSESDTKTSVSEDDIQSLVEQTLTKRQQEERYKSNLEQVDSQLAEAFGDEAGSVVQKKAQELGMSMDKLKEIAAESPNAFLALVGEKPKEGQSMRTDSTIRTEGLNTDSSRGKRNNAYYQELRRKEPRTFNTAAIQNQMIEDRMKLGDAFYN
jgi:hypothetical protein